MNPKDPRIAKFVAGQGPVSQYQLDTAGITGSASAGTSISGNSVVILFGGREVLIMHKLPRKYVHVTIYSRNDEVISSDRIETIRVVDLAIFAPPETGWGLFIRFRANERGYALCSL